METIANSGYFKTFDGVGLFERRWESDGEAKAHLALLHGYGEHCGRWTCFATWTLSWRISSRVLVINRGS